MSEKSMIIPAIFDDCEAIQIVNGVPALVIQDKDGSSDNFFNTPASEFIRRTGVSLRLLENLDTLLGVPLYWMQGSGYETDPERDFDYRFANNPTIFSSYQAYSRTLIARGTNFGSGSAFGPRPFTIIFSYSKPDEYNPDGLVTLGYIDE